MLRANGLFAMTGEWILRCAQNDFLIDSSAALGMTTKVIGEDWVFCSWAAGGGTRGFGGHVS